MLNNYELPRLLNTAKMAKSGHPVAFNMTVITGGHTMVKTLISFLTIATFLSLANASFALRCGSDVVNIGDLKIEV